MRTLLIQARAWLEPAWTQPRARLRVSTAIFLVALVLRVTVVMVGREYKDSTRFCEPVNIARSLYRTGSYSNPFHAGPTGPTAHIAPFYPFLLSLIYHAAGDNQTAEILKRFLSSAVSSLVFALLPALAPACGMPVIVGVLAGIAAALFPLSLYTETSGNSEMPWIALGLALLTLVTLHYYRAGCRSVGRALWCGLGWGLALLITPVFLAPLSGFLLTGLLRAPVERRVFVRRAALTVAVAVLVTVPWTIRNYVQLGALVPVRSNFGLEFAVSNHPEALPTLEDNLSSDRLQRLHPNHNPAEALRVRQMGEVAYNRQRLDEGMRWVRAHPERFLALTARRVAAFWFPVSRTLVKTVLFWCLPPLAAVGLWRLARRASLAAWLLGSLLAAYPVTYYVVQTSHRYRYPIDWALLLLAVYSVLTSRIGRSLLGDTGPVES